MTANSDICAECGTAVEDTPGAAERVPCPNCGAPARIISPSVQLTGIASLNAQLTVVSYPEALLTTARELLGKEQFSIATVVAHMACEIATERALTEAFHERQIGYLEESVSDLLNGYNLANDKVRSVYTALAGDDIQNQPFWAAFSESARRRNRIIHAGKIVQRGEAEESLNTASSFIHHVQRPRC